MTKDEIKPLDRSELQPCASCRKGLLHTGDIHFYEVTVSQCVADLDGIRTQHGLEVMMGGAAALAGAFSPTTRVAHRLPPVRRLVCSLCSMKPQAIALLVEGE